MRPIGGFLAVLSFPQVPFRHLRLRSAYFVPYLIYFPSRIRTDKRLERRETHHAASAALAVLWPAVGGREDELELKEWVSVMQRCVFCGLHLSWLFCRYSFRLVDSFSCYSDTTN